MKHQKDAEATRETMWSYNSYDSDGSSFVGSNPLATTYGGGNNGVNMVTNVSKYRTRKLPKSTQFSGPYWRFQF
jgi:hypothetical protein